MYVGEQHRYRSRTKHILNRIGLKPAASQAMSNYERTGHTVEGTALYYRRSLHCANIPPLTNMEATGCRLAMTGHSTLVIVSVYLPSPKLVAPARPKSPLCRDAVIVSTALEKIDTPNLNSIPNDIASTDEIDCHRCSYQPRQDGGRGERAGVSGILGSPEVSARYSRIDKSSFAPREHIPLSTDPERELSNAK
ncbi:hypothetical protein EVAR_78526_1 [Eumeta japonica]|uniref:Uncharacterized protein n=1 Tax=Eumeta variegata TaxID=151549 RepID=A0A4C1ZQW0_EUMVA|nr:hypothetical protein EVAR_78526_1 [Eumeta japonica]